MKVSAQEVMTYSVETLDDLDSVLSLTVDEALSIALQQSDEKGNLSEQWYEGILDKLGETERNAFTMGIAGEGIMVRANRTTDLDRIKYQVADTYRKKGCIYEDDYYEICRGLDTRSVGEFNMWLVASGIPMKKNPPPLTHNMKDTDYRKKVRRMMTYPDINKLKKKMPRSASIRRNAQDLSVNTLDSLVQMIAADEGIDNWDQAHATKGVLEIVERFEADLYDLLGSEEIILDMLKPEYSSIDLIAADASYLALMTLMEHGVGIWDGRWDHFFYDPKKDIPILEEKIRDKLGHYADVTGAGLICDELREAASETIRKSHEMAKPEMTAGKKTAQRIDEEKRQLEDTIRARQSQIPNWKQLLKKVQKAFDFSELRDVWEELKQIPAFASLYGDRDLNNLFVSRKAQYKQRIEPGDYVLLPSGFKAIVKEVGDGAAYCKPTEGNERSGWWSMMQLFRLKNVPKGKASLSKIKIDDHEFFVHVADSVEAKTAGLEKFDGLEANEGMLFPFHKSGHVTFHMGSVAFPIDIIFLRQSGNSKLKIAKIIHNAQPGTEERWSHYDARAVIELSGGICKRLNIGIDSTCVI